MTKKKRNTFFKIIEFDIYRRNDIFFFLDTDHINFDNCEFTLKLIVFDDIGLPIKDEELIWHSEGIWESNIYFDDYFQMISFPIKLIKSEKAIDAAIWLYVQEKEYDQFLLDREQREKK